MSVTGVTVVEDNAPVFLVIFRGPLKNQIIQRFVFLAR